MQLGSQLAKRRRLGGRQEDEEKKEGGGGGRNQPKFGAEGEAAR